MSTGYGNFFSPSGSQPTLTQFLYNGIVGSTAQVQAGVANYSSIQTAISSTLQNGIIRVLSGIYNENVSITATNIRVEGSGNGTQLMGTLTFGASCGYACVTGMGISGAITFNATSFGNQLVNCWQGASLVCTDSGVGNYVEITQG